jgi:hypothetical protein
MLARVHQQDIPQGRPFPARREAKAVQGLDLVKLFCLVAALYAFAPSQAEAIEIIGGLSPAAYINHGMVLTAALHRGGPSQPAPPAQPSWQSARRFGPPLRTRFRPPALLSARLPPGLPSMGETRLVSLGAGRRGRRRGGDGLRYRGDRLRLGERSAAGGSVLVLQRSQPPAGLLGPMPIRFRIPS